MCSRYLIGDGTFEALKEGFLRYWTRKGRTFSPFPQSARGYPSLHGSARAVAGDIRGEGDGRTSGRKKRAGCRST